MLYDRLKNYFVDDLLHVDNKVIFVLESPHTQEIKNGYPVAGKSGVDMSKVLFDKDEAFGKLVFEKVVTNIGILNVCNYPMQMSAYDIPSSTCREMEYFEKIRQNPKLRKKANPINSVIQKMMKDFKNRLSLHVDKKIVLCGSFAQNAFDGVMNESDFKEVIRVPHPSFNQWKRQSNKKVIEKLLEFVS